ncbi:MAG: hypothetical protein QOD30_1236 [Actinomycetota bacterium]|nr:hypothetical protein [Actinomycetota bacterium]
MRRVALVVALLVGIAACGGGTSGDKSSASKTTTTARNATSTTTKDAKSGDDVYDDADSWLCRPDKTDACEDDLDATVVKADGTTSPDPFHVAKDAPIDCFYVYPTVSTDPGANSDMTIGPEEQNVVRRQAARFGSVCSVYAPMYRQGTLTALTKLVTGGSNDFFSSYKEAYADVLAAWRHYLAHDNHGRGVIIFGHSQGSSHLLTLLEQEVDPSPAQRKLLVSAILLGVSAHESDLPHIPPCRGASQTGCIITWSTFRDTAPPPTDAYFGRPKGSETAICTNPGALAGGSGDLTGVYASDGWGVDVSTPFVEVPGLVSAECKDVGGINVLSITVHPDPGPRTDDVRGALTPQWGLHQIDASVAQLNLVEIARAEATAYTG